MVDTILSIVAAGQTIWYVPGPPSPAMISSMVYTILTVVIDDS